MQKFGAPVAVLMSVYSGDVAALLGRAIDSIRSQTYPGEKRIYLCVDGPISSELSRVIEARRSSIFYLTVNHLNSGLATSLNLLIQALGDEEYVFRMDADDYSLPDRFAETLLFMEAHQVDVCGAWIEEIHFRGTRRLVKYRQQHDAIVRAIAVGSPVAHPTVCFRRTVLLKCPAYPLKRSNEDIAFWFLLLQGQFRFGNVQKVLLEFTVNENFFRRRARGKAYEELLIYLQGLYRLHGFSVMMLAPIARFCVRLLPSPLAKCAYATRWLIGR